jgi:hypothetical protein
VNGDPVNHTDRHGLLVDVFDCDFDFDSCGEGEGASDYWGDCYGDEFYFMGVPDPGCPIGPAPGPAPAPAPKGQPCTDKTANILTTLQNIELDISGIVSAEDSYATAGEISALDNTMQSDIDTEMKNPLQFFVGGHFNLDLSLGQVADDLGGPGSDADNRFLQLFEGTTFDGVRQGPVPTTDPNHSYWLHSKPAAGNMLDVHFDRFNLWNDVVGAAGHFGVDYLWGHLGTHCLDPAWRSH